MRKSYPDELAEWVKGREATKPRQDKHAVAFLAVKSDVQAALEAGYSMKTIWEHMTSKGRLRCRYETFTKHVQRYLKGVSVSAPVPTNPSKPAIPQVKEPPPTSSEPRKGVGPAIPKFTFDPVPKKEDLL